MPQSAQWDLGSSVLDKAVLMKLKLRAMRKGVWFRCLPRIDRVLVEATLSVKASVRSFTLMKILCSVARKLEGLLEGKLQCATREIGVPLAQRLSAIAEKWGYVAAGDWRLDLGFARYLAAMGLNEHGTFGASRVFAGSGS